MLAGVKIVVALDKFKGSLDAPLACATVAQTLRALHPDWQIVVKPMADGGDGTARALVESLTGEWHQTEVMGPLPELRVRAAYGWLPDEHTGIVEMATASGLALLATEERNPLKTTTYGTGQLIQAACARGARRILLGVGGSATVDGGVGAAMALGWKFLDATGQSVGFGGGALHRIARLVPPARRKLPAVEVLCDVDNPLCGEHGAAAVFGPQKGATPAMVAEFDVSLRYLAGLVRTQLGKDILTIPGGGAAGGLGAGAVAFLNARIVPGAETIIRASHLETELANADWVITGEGKFDSQSLHGKVVSAIAAAAQRHNVKVAVLAGSVELSEAEWQEAGISFARPIASGLPLAEAMRRAPELLATAARQLVQML
jgi:glycerate kinase